MRLRRMRQQDWLRALAREHQLTVDDLILPLFVMEGEGREEAIPAMPGVFRYSIDRAVLVAKNAKSLGIRAIALFPKMEPHTKTADAAMAYDEQNLMARAISLIKQEVKGIGVIADIALDPYTSHGHDGLMDADGTIHNDQTIAVLAKQALTFSRAGADIVAPSDMMDGRIGAIRHHLDQAGFADVLILSYAAKYASHYYGPFRQAVGSDGALAQNIGNKSSKATYQMDPANRKEAYYEVALDIAEGADIVMVKPGLAYLDIVSDISRHSPVPVWVYQVSGEYSMLELAINQQIVSPDIWMETMIAFKRAGAKSIVTYKALHLAQQLG